MATRSFIGKQLPNGDIVGVYCHWDGYPEGVGKTLKAHYTDPIKVDALLTLGALSFLDAEVGEKHDFDNPRDGWTVAYHRDRGDRPIKQIAFKNSNELKRDCGVRCGAEFAYVMGKSGKWRTYKL